MSWFSLLRLAVALIWGSYQFEKGRLRREPLTSALGLALIITTLIVVFAYTNRTITVHVRYVPTTTTTTTGVRA